MGIPAPSTTHSSPPGPSGARFAVLGTSLSSVLGGWVLPRYTHPAIPVQAAAPTPGRVCTCTGTPPDTARTRTYGPVVGEPRGVEHTAVLGSGTGYIQFYEVWEVHTAV